MGRGWKSYLQLRHLAVVTYMWSHTRTHAFFGQYYQNIHSDSTIMSLISWFALFSVLFICISQIVFSIDGKMASLQVYKARVSLLTSVDEQCIPRLWIINLTLHILCIISSSFFKKKMTFNIPNINLYT